MKDTCGKADERHNSRKQQRHEVEIITQVPVLGTSTSTGVCYRYHRKSIEYMDFRFLSTTGTIR